jgi:IPT/TIG domain-containing protein/galactose oxidase-like protein
MGSMMTRPPDVGPYRLLSKLACAGTLAFAASAATAQVDWIQSTPATSPPARFDHNLAFDSARNRTILFGGVDFTFTEFGDTWEWDGAAWSQRTPVSSPPPRETTALAYDSARGRTVLFGGTDNVNGTVRGDTWEWDGTNWTQAAPATSPSARSGHAMVYDAARGRTVLFGGSDAFGNPSAETWEWDGASWSNVTPATSPPARYFHDMAYDPIRARVVLFGGFIAFDSRVNDTWEWDGASWTQASPVTSPSARNGHAMAFSTSRARVVVFGGSEFFGSFLGDTWEWDGTNWSSLSTATAPPGRVFHAMAGGPGCGRLVLFAGLPGGEGGLPADTWELGSSTSTTLASVAPHAGSTSGGELVHLFGSGFTTVGDTTVEFGGTGAVVLSVSATRIDVTSPPGSAGPVDVRMHNSVCDSTLPGGYTYVLPEFAARYGNANQGVGERDDCLLINSVHGDETTREISLTRTTPFRLVAVPPSSRATARFAAYVWVGDPGAANLTAQPFSLGTAVFPTPLNVGQTPQPRRIFNNFDPRLGTANLPSTRAPSTLINRPGGLGVAITAVFQGVIQDSGSIIPQHASLTNAIVVRIP